MSKPLANRNFVGFTIVVNHQRMVHRNICRPLFKVSYRISARRHHITQKLVGVRYRTPGTVNEPSLDAAPRLCESRPVAWGEWLDVEGLDTVIAPFKPGFSMPPAPAFCQGAVIFSSTKLSAQPFCPALSENKHQGDACNDNHAECNE
jgi:hypothetical protein